MTCKPSYPGYTITRWITLFGGEGTTLPHESVLIYCNNQGKVIINDTAPQTVKDAFIARINATIQIVRRVTTE